MLHLKIQSRCMRLSLFLFFKKGWTFLHFIFTKEEEDEANNTSFAFIEFNN